MHQKRTKFRIRFRCQWAKRGLVATYPVLYWGRTQKQCGPVATYAVLYQGNTQKRGRVLAAAYALPVSGPQIQLSGRPDTGTKRNMGGSEVSVSGMGWGAKIVDALKERPHSAPSPPPLLHGV